MESVLILCGRSEILICSFADELKTLGVFDMPKEISTPQENNKHISDPITGGRCDEAASNHMKERCEAVATTQ